MARIRRWPVWNLNRPARTYLFAVEFVTAVGVAAFIWVSASSDASTLVRLGGLLALAGLYAELGDRVERIWIWLHTDRGAWAAHSSVFLFTGVLVLPAWAALVQCAVVYAHMGWRSHRYRTTPAHRWIWSATTVLLATAASSAIFHALGGELTHVGFMDLAAILLALATYTGINLVVLLSGMYLAVRPPTITALVPERREFAYEIFKLLLDLVGAVLILQAPLLTPVILVMAAMLHRSSLVTDLVTDATTDAKTGLMTAKAWRDAATRCLGRAERSHEPVAALIIDLDHFKSVNDSRGHIAGDAVLAGVGEVLAAEVRSNDWVGRYGGEEFVVLLEGTDRRAAMEVADRMRRRVAALEAVPGIRITASVGVAAANSAKETDLDELLLCADRALYEAKAAGRDMVCAAAMIV